MTIETNPLDARLAGVLTVKTASCANFRVLFQSQFQALANRYPTWLRVVSQATSVATSPVALMPMAYMISRIPWTALERRNARELEPAVNQLLEAYGELRDATGAALERVMRQRRAPLLEAAITAARREGIETQGILNAWYRTGVSAGTPRQVPVWLDYLTPRRDLQVFWNHFEQSQGAVVEAIYGSEYEHPEPEPEPVPTTDNTGQIVVLAVIGLVGWKLLKK